MGVCRIVSRHLFSRKHHSMTSTFSPSGCTAIITGASSGLGIEFARQLATQSACIVLAARRGELLQKVADDLKVVNTALKVVICACDLSTEEGRALIWAEIDAAGLHPTLLINNAGLGDYGEMATAPEARIRTQIDLNITALTLLTREFAIRAHATADRPAGIVHVGSLAATLPIPDLAVYAATKAYVMSLSEALSVEFAERHIHVSCVCPGPTPTNFGTNARRPDEKDIDRSGQGLLRVMPEEVVRDSLRALQRGKACVFPSVRVTFAAFIFRIMPRFLMRLFIRLRYAKGRSK
jgi:short-subunit dehydrogenase